MRFKAPPHTTQVHLSNGVFDVDQDGFVEIPDDVPADGIFAQGFVLADPTPAPTSKKQPLDLTPADEHKGD